MTIDIGKVDEDYGRQLRNVAYQIVKDYDLAKDVMQESLIKIWKNQSKYDKSKSGLWTWMRTIVTRTALDYYRTRSNSRKLIEPSEDYVLSKGFEIINIETIDLHTIIGKLKPKYSLILEEHCIKGFTQSQISKTHGIPLGTVKSRLKIGLRELKLIYKD